MSIVGGKVRLLDKAFFFLRGFSMHAEPQAEHQWLQKLVGEWTFTSECDAGPNNPAMKTEGSEVVRSLGGLWTVGESTAGEGDDRWSAIMTLGYDPNRKNSSAPSSLQ
jgi:hypothetical protein